MTTPPWCMEGESHGILYRTHQQGGCLYDGAGWNGMILTWDYFICNKYDNADVQKDKGGSAEVYAPILDVTVT